MHRYPEVCYTMLKVLDESGTITWASPIGCLFSIFGEPNWGSFFIICSASAVHVQSAYVG